MSDQDIINSFPPVEHFTPDEELALMPYVTNTDKPVFALVNLPEVVKGALFARYSRSSKSLRRLLLDEFLEDLPKLNVHQQANHQHAEALYNRVFNEYGDDSVAQLGSVHLACEGVSNMLTKVLERGRLMSYLEQSTRYIPYNDQIEGKWKYHIPEELKGEIRTHYCDVLDLAFSTYAKWLEPMEAHFRKRYPISDGTSAGAYKRTIRAKALDVLRGLLPSATRSNLGIFGSGQAYEALLLRMRASQNSETRAFAKMILDELQKVIPSFMARVDRPDRGIIWSEYLAQTDERTKRQATTLIYDSDEVGTNDVTLTDFDPDGELKVIAAALYAFSSVSDDQLMSKVKGLNKNERFAILKDYVGDRRNRRHRPGRAFERTYYRFDILTDYAAFRDLQRHRLLSIEWQTLSTRHGYLVPEAIGEAGALDDWKRVMEASEKLYQALIAQNYKEAAPCAVSMAYRIRFYMEMNAREAMHMIELRTTPQGHSAYRSVCQKMHILIAEQAGHRAIAEAMRFANHEQIELERLESENASASN